MSNKSIVTMKVFLEKFVRFETERRKWSMMNSPGNCPKCCPMFHCGARLILVVQRCRPLRLLSMLRLQQLEKHEEKSIISVEICLSFVREEIYRWQHQEYHVGPAAFRWQKRFKLDKTRSDDREGVCPWTLNLQIIVTCLDFNTRHDDVEYDQWISMVSISNG